MNRAQSPTTEQLAQKVVEGIIDNGGEFIMDGAFVHILLGGRRIQISPDFNNTAYAAIQIEHTGKGTVQGNGRAICQHVAVLGGELASRIRLAKFSAMSDDKTRLYVPVKDGLLQISKAGILGVANGANPDSIWLEHPNKIPFQFLSDCEVREGLQEFERLCVETLSCDMPSHKWLVAMHEGLFPLVRQRAQARMLVEHNGGSQRGKTSGASRFVKLHGLGEVLGDVSTSYLRNNCDGLGLLVLDNKEQANFAPDLINFLLFAATGAKSGRSTQDGAAREMSDRPVVVTTSIEGIFKQELQKRRISIPFGGVLKAEHADRDFIEESIEQRRDLILSSICHVLCAFMKTEVDSVQERLLKLPQSPWPEFPGYVRVLATLLYAYAEVSGRRSLWADGVLKDIFESFNTASCEREDDVLEAHVYRTLEFYEAIRGKHEAGGDLPANQHTLLSAIVRHDNYEFQGKLGILYVSTAKQLLSAMKTNSIGFKELPNNASGMGKRLESSTWINLKVLRAEDDPRLLARSSTRRPVGVFRPKDAVMT